MSRAKRPDAVVYAELAKAIELANGVTPCRESSLFTTTKLSAGDLRIARQVCNSCPIFADCYAAGRELSNTARANTVMGGVSYGDRGKPIVDRPLTVVAQSSNRVAKTDVKAAA